MYMNFHIFKIPYIHIFTNNTTSSKCWWILYNESVHIVNSSDCLEHFLNAWNRFYNLVFPPIPGLIILLSHGAVHFLFLPFFQCCNPLIFSFSWLKYLIPMFAEINNNCVWIPSKIYHFDLVKHYYFYWNLCTANSVQKQGSEDIRNYPYWMTYSGYNVLGYNVYFLSSSKIDILIS